MVGGQWNLKLRELRHGGTGWHIEGDGSGERKLSGQEGFACHGTKRSFLA